MNYLRKFARAGLWFLDFFVLELTPRYVTLAISLGLALGLIQPLTLHWLALFTVTLLLPVPLGVAALVALPLHLLAPALDPLFHRLGALLLTAGWLRPVWTFFYHLPILPFTRFNNTVVLGSTLCAAILAVGLGAVLWRILRVRWAHLRWLRDRSPSWGSLSRTFVGKRYFGTSSDQRWIRWEALALGCLAVAIFSLFLFRGIAAWARPRAEALLSFLHGAPVIIETLHVNLWAPSVDLRNVVLMRSNGRETLLHLEKLRVQLAWGPLLAKKFVITDIAVEGVHLGSPGQTRFSDDEQRVTLSEVSGAGGALSNSIAGNLHKKLREDFGPNPLRTVEEFGSQMELSRRLAPLIPALPIVKEIRANQEPVLAAVVETEKKLEEILQKFPSDKFREEAEATRANPAARPDYLQRHNDAVAEIQNTDEQIRRDLIALREKLKTLQDTIPLALQQLKAQLHLPQIDQADASPTIFGPHLIHFLERIGHWVDRSRRLMPTGQSTLVSQERGRGQSLHFGEPGQPPLFLLTRADFRNDGAEKPGLGRVKGYIANVTSDPSLLGKPTEGEIEFEFPESQWKGGRIKLRVDHTGATPEETIELHIAELPLATWRISDTKPLGILATAGQGTLDASVVFKGQEISAVGKLQARDLSVDVLGPDREIIQTLQTSLARTPNFTLEGEVKGPLEAPSIRLKSDWGITLQEALRQAFQVPIAALDDAIRQVLLDEIDPPLRKQETNLTSQLRHVSQRLGSLVDALHQIREKTEPVRRSLSSSKKKK